jgi:hypothetical protein
MLLDLSFILDKFMPALSVPARDFPRIKQLMEASEALVAEVSNLLKTGVPSADRDSLIQEIANKIGKDQRGKVTQILELLDSMYLAITSSGIHVEVFVEDVLETIKSTNDFEGVTGEDFSNLERRLKDFLSQNNSLSISTKAFDVLTEHQKVYVRSRIFTDVRPVFSQQLDQGVSGFVMVNMLKIEYRENGERKEFFVALDNSDLKNLEVILERSLKKTTQIASVLEGTNIHHFKVE